MYKETFLESIPDSNHKHEYPVVIKYKTIESPGSFFNMGNFSSKQELEEDHQELEDELESEGKNKKRRMRKK